MEDKILDDLSKINSIMNLIHIEDFKKEVH